MSKVPAQSGVAVPELQCLSYDEMTVTTKSQRFGGAAWLTRARKGIFSGASPKPSARSSTDRISRAPNLVPIGQVVDRQSAPAGRPAGERTPKQEQSCH